MFDSILSLLIGLLISYLILNALKNFFIKSNNKTISKVNNDDKKIIAWHEVGHALMAYKAKLRVSEISLLPQVKDNHIVYGRTMVHFENKLKNKKIIEDEIKIYYGGRCAELILFNGNEDLITDGCSADIEQSTSLIHMYMNKLGFSKKAGLLNFELLKYESDDLMNETIELSQRLEKETYDFLESKKELIEILTEKLLEKQKISEKEFVKIVEEFNEKQNEFNQNNQ